MPDVIILMLNVCLLARLFGVVIVVAVTVRSFVVDGLHVALMIVVVVGVFCC